MKSFKILLKDGMYDFKKRDKVEDIDRESYVDLCSCMSAYHVLEGVKQADKEGASKHFEESNQFIMEAEKYNQYSPMVWLRKGLLLLAKGSFEAAEYQLSSVQQAEPNLIAAKLVSACVSFCAGSYKQALAGFQSCLKQIPNSGPVELRLAIGFCFEKLGFPEAARIAFERVLTMMEGKGAISALTALAVLNLNEGIMSKEAFQQGMQQLKQAYELDKNNPVILNHLGNHFFFKKDYKKSEVLLRNSLTHSEDVDDKVKAETMYILGKLAHIQGNLDEAYRNYFESTRLNGELKMSQFGLGQCLVARKDYINAIGCLEKVLTTFTNNHEATRLLGLLLMESSGKNVGRCPELLTKALKDHQDSPNELADIYLSLGYLLAERNQEEALQVYLKAKELDPERFEGNPMLLNNLGVLAGSVQQLDEALKHCQLKGGEVYDTILFNKARLLESNYTESKRIYQEIIVRRPGHISSHLRLGCLALSHGQNQEAIDHFKEAIGQDENCFEAWTLLANTQLRMKAVTPARKSFERILQKLDRHDIYALVSLGNLYVDLGRSDKASRLDYFRRAMEFYQKAISLEPKNHLAANGLGMVLAEMGHYERAKEIFIQVRLADPSNTDAISNLGHCFVELGQYGAAVSVYEHLLETQPSAKVRLSALLYLARALLCLGKAEKQSNHLRRAITYLQEAQEKLPKDTPILFNIALCKQELASILIKTKVSPSTGEEGVGLDKEAIQEATDSLCQSKDLLTRLITGDSSSGIDGKLVEQRLAWCDSLQETLTSRLNKSQSKDDARRSHLAALQAKRAEEQAVIEAEEAEKKAQWQAEQARIEQARKEMAERLKLVEEKVVASSSTTQTISTTPSRTGKKRAKDHEEHVAEEEDDQDDDEEVIPSTRKRSTRTSTGRPSTLSKDFISSSDLDEDE